jgi:hypothetical protein
VTAFWAKEAGSLEEQSTLGALMEFLTVKLTPGAIFCTSVLIRMDVPVSPVSDRAVTVPSLLRGRMFPFISTEYT